MIDFDEINPLDWHNTRFLTTIPKHFSTITVETQYKFMLQWLTENTRGRIGITKEIKEGHDYLFYTSYPENRNKYLVGFEDDEEALFFRLKF